MYVKKQKKTNENCITINSHVYILKFMEAKRCAIRKCLTPLTM